MLETLVKAKIGNLNILQSKKNDLKKKTLSIFKI